MDPTSSWASGERISFYPPRLRLLLLVLTCGLLGGIFLLMTQARATFLIGLGWSGVALMALAAVVLLLRALRPGPTVIIDEVGITDRTTLAQPGLIRWEEITVIRKKEIGRGRGAERLLEIVLSDPDSFQRRPRSPGRHLIERYRTLMKQPLVHIPGSMVSVPIQEVMDTIRSRRPDLQVLEGPPPPPPKFRFSNKPPPKRQHPDLPHW